LKIFSPPLTSLKTNEKSLKNVMGCPKLAMAAIENDGKYCKILWHDKKKYIVGSASKIKNF